jgi:hypothetical protein
MAADGLRREEDPEEQSILASMREMKAAGQTTRQIADELNRHGGFSMLQRHSRWHDSWEQWGDKMRAMRFDDDYYCQTVEEFENNTSVERSRRADIEWGMILLLTALLFGGDFAGYHWDRWRVLIGAAFPFWLVLVFLHEVNENLRFVRHQLRVYRDAVHEVAKTAQQYRNRDSFSPADAIEMLDRAWEHPK